MSNPILKIPIDKAGHHYMVSVCIEFEALYDIPFGIIRTIQYHYNDPSVFLQRWMNYDNYTLRAVLYERDQYNPVLAAMIKPDIAKADTILQDIYRSSFVYKTVLKHSPLISMANFLHQLIVLKSGNNGDILNYKVICKNEMQANKLKEDFRGVEYSLNGFDFNVHPYDLIILEKYENILQYSKKKPVVGKQIWIPEFAYNMDQDQKDTPDLTISTLIGDVNKISTYEPYSNFNKPVG